MGIDNARFSLETIADLRPALAFSSLSAGTKSNAICWLGQMTNQALNAIISAIPIPIAIVVCGRANDVSAPMEPLIVASVITVTAV